MLSSYVGCSDVVDALLIYCLLYLFLIVLYHIYVDTYSKIAKLF